MVDHKDFSDTKYLKKVTGLGKAILHDHWDGCLDHRAIFNDYQRRGKQILLPENDTQGNTIYYKSQDDRIIKSADDLRKRFFYKLITKHSIVDTFAIPVDAMKTRESLQKAAWAHSRDLASQGIKYSETRFAPWYHTNPEGGLNTMADVLLYTIMAFNEAEKETGVTVKPIVCINREIMQIDPSGKTTLEIAQTARAFEGEVVALDIACSEFDTKIAQFFPAYKELTGSSVVGTAHVDEMLPKELGIQALRETLKLPNIKGLGHAIHLAEDPESVDFVAGEGIRIESCPRSNLEFGFIQDVKELKLDELVDRGALVTAGHTDDQTMWDNGTVAHNFYLIGKTYGHDFAKQLARNSVHVAFALTSTKKESLLQEINDRD
jgi:adenosine deaminase